MQLMYTGTQKIVRSYMVVTTNMYFDLPAMDDYGFHKASLVRVERVHLVDEHQQSADVVRFTSGNSEHTQST